MTSTTPKTAEDNTRVKVMVQKRINELNQVIEDAKQKKLKLAAMRNRKANNQNDLQSLLDQVGKLSEAS